MLLLRSELAERLEDELLERGTGLWNACKGAFGLAVAEAHARERSEGFRSRIGNGGIYGAAIAGALGMGEVQVRGSRARDDELAGVNGVVVRSAEEHEVFGGVGSVLRPKRDVVHIRKNRVTTAGDATFPTVPVKDCTTDSGGMVWAARN